MRRYPGLSPFSAEQKDVFFGRTNDIRELSKLIFVERKVLLYSKSGYGKTSLLNAGVVPELSENEGFEFIHIRFRAFTSDGDTPDKTFLQTVKQHPDFKNTANNTLIDSYAQEFDDEYWSVFKKNQLAGNHNKTYLLVFDQFEELFTYPDVQISRFKNKLADILAGKMPEFIRNFERELFKNKKSISKTDFELFYNAINIKVVFSMRSDRLSELNALADKIPDIQKVFYELQPLNKEQAEQAIINPAKQEGDFESQAFTYEKAALEKIIDALAGKGKIETTQLQIVCQRIEENIIANNVEPRRFVEPRRGVALQNPQNGVALPTITPNDIPDFNDIFLDFYNSSVAKVKTDDLHKVRKFIEDQLIIEGRRISLDEFVCQRYIKNETLKTLVETRLLRAERNSVEGFSYELSHDTLVPPIKEIADKRREREKKEEEERIRQEELRKEREKQKRQRKIILIVSIAAILSVVFGIFGIVMWQKAEEQTKIAKQEKQRSDSLFREAQTAIEKFEEEERKRKKTEINNLIQKASNYKTFGETDLAKKALKQALQIDSTHAEANKMLNELEN